MQSHTEVQELLFQAFVLQALSRKLLFSPDSAEIVDSYCDRGAKTLVSDAESEFSSDDQRSRWISQQLISLSSSQIPKAIDLIASEARAFAIETGFTVIRETDTRPAFIRLCPGFWPFC